jgi:hypothetical protein
MAWVKKVFVAKLQKEEMDALSTVITMLQDIADEDSQGDFYCDVEMDTMGVEWDSIITFMQSLKDKSELQE